MGVTLSIIMPVYNERRTIREIIARVRESARGRDAELIVVDDGSTDGTRNILRELAAADPALRLIVQPRNRGKGAAVRAGIAAATRDVVLIQDADLEYDPDDYAALLHPIESGRADAVLGSRFQHGERRVLYFWHAVGNHLLTLATNMAANLNLTDVMTCYKAVKRPIIQSLRLDAERFGIEPELAIKLARCGCAVYEVPINYYGRTYAQGKKIKWADAFAVLGQIVMTALEGRGFIRDKAAVEGALAMPPPPEHVGIETLEAFEGADRYNQWIFSRFAPFVGRRVLEIGSGIGNIIQEVLARPDVEQAVATDIDTRALGMLRDRLGDDHRLKVVTWPAESANLPAELEPGTYDTLICSNVLEHIEDHAGALRQMHKLLAPGGRLLLLVPAHMWAYTDVDRDLDHFRRYDELGLARLLRENGFALPELIQHNAVGLWAWWWTGKVLKRRKLATGSVRSFDKLVPLLRPIDGLLVKVCGGVSLIAVAEKPKNAPEAFARVVGIDG